MSYSKIWTPNSIPSGTDLNAWKALNQEIDRALLDNMWILDETATNLDLSSITSLPEPSGSFVGSRTYILNDTHRTVQDIYMRVRFGIINGGWGDYSYDDFCICPSFFIEVSSHPSFPTALTYSSQYPSQHIDQTPTDGSLRSPYPGTSVVSYQPEIGFYSLIFGIDSIQTGSRGMSSIGLTRIPRLASFCVIIQRNMDENGTIIPGFTCIGAPNTDSFYSIEDYYYGRICNLKFVSDQFQTPQVTNHSPIPFDGQIIAVNGQPQVFPIFTLTPTLMQLPSCLSYADSQITNLTEFEAETPLGTRTFIALGDNVGFNLSLNNRLAILTK